MKQIVLLAFGLLLLSACGSKLDGTTYELSTPMGKISMKFESGGKVYTSVMGVETEMKYEVDGNKVKLITAQGNQILTLREDGSLEGLPFGALRKKLTSGQVEGTYSQVVDGKQVLLTLESGGKVRLSREGQKIEAKYEVDGNKVKIFGAEGKAEFFTWREDGSLEGPNGIRLAKK